MCSVDKSGRTKVCREWWTVSEEPVKGRRHGVVHRVRLCDNGSDEWFRRMVQAGATASSIVCEPRRRAAKRRGVARKATEGGQIKL